MGKYEQIKADMTNSLKTGDKARRAVLADIIAAVDKASVAGKTRVEITDILTNEVLTKYKKTVQEMIDTCPNTEKYAGRKAEYIANMAVVNEYAPQMVTDEAEITAMIRECCEKNGVEPIGSSKKIIMPYLKSLNCDMKVAQSVLNGLIG